MLHPYFADKEHERHIESAEKACLYDVDTHTQKSVYDHMQSWLASFFRAGKSSAVQHRRTHTKKSV
ncbi:hypothetical protein DNH61_01715 [Paenibacillus sambharensis]|uniref:Uncharacterized protein n=1 Tax=Paenibacillus sambharensis TaxID=1803190 RepID=A0A2W1LS66_9BACL|nr:hypothetical protein [Paenibacillus sambharensis]PZD97615.1 hypothetical protein DNH61_01715 [Paenibacillus sambharensis]